MYTHEEKKAISKFPQGQILCRLYKSPLDETVNNLRSPVCIHTKKKRPHTHSNGPMLRILTKKVMMADHKIKSKTGHLLMFLMN